MKRNRNVIVLILIIITAVLVIGGISRYKAKPSDSQPIKIGVFTPLTGEASSYGEAIRHGLDLAAEDANNSGGVLGHKIELDYQDTRLDAKEAVAAMNKFITIDKYSFVIAAEGSGATQAAVPLADQNKTLTMVAIASTPSLNNAGQYVFRVVPSDDYQGKVMADYAAQKGYKSASILYANDAYGVGIKEAFSKSFSGKVVAVEAFENNDGDFRSQISKIKATNSDVVVIAARKEFVNIFQQAKELRLGKQIIGSETLKDDELIQASGAASEGAIMPYFATATDYVGFAAKYQAKYGSAPANYSDFGYDSLAVLVEGIRKAGKIDATAARNALRNISFKGATGVIKFDERGQVTEKPFIFYQVENGKIIEIKK